MIELREHNLAPYERLCKMLEYQDKVAYISATGTGKSFVGGRYIEEHNLQQNTLILVPSDVIRDSWRRMLPGIKILSYQGMLNNKPDLSDCRLLICDEMHHLGAEKWGSHYQEMTEGFSGKIIGMSATPVRFLDHSRNMIDELFDGNRVVGMELPEAIGEGILPAFDYIAALYNLPAARPKDTGRCAELTKNLYKQLDVMENELSFQRIIQKHMKPGVHKVAVFVPHIDDLDEYKGVIAGAYPDASHFVAHSDMARKDRADAISEFENSSGMSFLYTVDLLNEGIHIEGVDTVVMFRKTESPTIFLQQLGRALTANLSDTRITVFDFVANHVRVKGKRDGAGSVIDWINESIGDPLRQVIKHDYASAAQEVLDRISYLLSDVWKEEENDLIRRYYGTEGGKEKLIESLPTRNWKTIAQQAWLLGLSQKYERHITDELVSDVGQLVGQEGGRERLEEKYPNVPWASIVSVAKKLGIYTPHHLRPWTEEEDEMIRANPKDTQLLASMMPDRTVEQIRARRVKLGLSKSRPVFTEEHKNIMIANQHMNSGEMQREFFPDWSRTYVADMRKKLGVQPEEQEPFWTKEVNQMFSDAYVQGGSAAVREIPLFAHMTRKQIGDRARRIDVKTIKRQGESCVPFSENEIKLLTEWALNGDSHSNEEIMTLFPEHTVGSVRVKVRKLRRKMVESKEGQNA